MVLHDMGQDPVWLQLAAEYNSHHTKFIQNNNGRFHSLHDLVSPYATNNMNLTCMLIVQSHFSVLAMEQYNINHLIQKALNIWVGFCENCPSYMYMCTIIIIVIT